MTPTPRDEAARRIVDAMRPAMSDLEGAVVARIRAELELYRDADVVPVAELQASVADNVEFMVAGLTGAAPVDLRAPEATGRARAAQGAPLVELLSAYRIGFAEMWARVVATARALPDVSEDAVVDLAGTVFALQNQYCDAAIAGYREEAQHLVRSSERERAVLVESVLTGSASTRTLWEVAQALRLPLDGVFVVVVARAEPGHDPLPRAESALAAQDVRSVWRLESRAAMGVLSMGEPARVGTAFDVLARHATGPAGASPVFTELRQAAGATRLAQLALDTHPGGIGVEQIRARPLTLLLAAAPQAALEAARAVLGGVLGLPADDRDLLLTTFAAWVDGGGSAPAAAATLFCHPNTVRYRLRRIETATGRSLGDPADLAELVAAAQAWSQLPHPAEA
jgi:hypothetical protein